MSCFLGIVVCGQKIGLLGSTTKQTLPAHMSCSQDGEEWDIRGRGDPPV